MEATGSIYYHSEETSFKLNDPKSISNWVENCIVTECKSLGDINYIFCNDEYLLSLNVDYLNHDTYTDIITFNYVKDSEISGDIFISIERAKENANQLNINFETELFRVMIHGVLHLIGYNDKTPEEAALIRSKEDFYLTSLPQI